MLLQRHSNFRDPERLLIVISTEGEKTEKQYFERFKTETITALVLETPHGESSPLQVKQRLLSFLTLHPHLPSKSAWLVMDTDRHASHLPAILAEAKQVGFQVAISNPCFELWLWLHHFEVDLTLTTCRQLKRALDAINGFDFHSWNPAGNNQHREQVRTAIQRANQLTGTDTLPIPHFPGTNIASLAQQLLMQQARE